MIAAAALVALVIGALVGWSASRSWVWNARRHRRIVVTLKSGDGFQGVLAGVDAHTLALRDAEKLGGDTNVPVDGEVIVQLADIKYAQRL